MIWLGFDVVKKMIWFEKKCVVGPINDEFVPFPSGTHKRLWGHSF